MKTTKPQFRWAKLMHHFDRVELVTFRSNGITCTRSIWGQEETEELSCQSDELMLCALKEKHSFVYIKSGEIRLIKAWLKNGRFISNYPEFLKLVELSTGIGEDSESGNAYLSLFRRNMIDNRQWNKTALIRAWKDLQGVGIGAGANKEMIEVSSHRGLLSQFDLNLEALIDANAKGTNNILKSGKYLGRILRPFRYCMFEKPHINQLDADPDAYDGFSLISREFAARCGLHTKAGDRVEVTMLTDQGLIKGHGEIRNIKDDAVVFGDQYKQEVKGACFNGFEKLKKSIDVYLDIQTIINIPKLWEHIPDWIDRMLVEVLKNIRDGKFPAFMSRIDDLDLREDGSLKRERWVLKHLVQHQIPLVFPWIIRRIWNFYSEYLIRPAKLRVKIPGAIRVYLTPDVIASEPTIKQGSCIIRGSNLYISRVDKDWLCTLLGGADFDDSVVCIPLPENRILIYRNPNQFGEWAVLKIEKSDHVFTEFHNISMPKCQRWNVWPEGQSMTEAKARIQDFWDYMKGRQVEKCLQSRVPENIAESIEFIHGPLTMLFELAKAKIFEADEAIKLYCQQVEIPELFMERSKLYPVARELRVEYGTAVSKSIKRTESISDLDEKTAYFKTQIDKINARVRGALTKYSEDEQKLIMKDLAHLCYITLPGSGSDLYKLTQANDGILGIPSSAGERNLGTAHIFIDLLLDLGIGVRIERDENSRAIYKTSQSQQLPKIEGNIITLVGSWRRLVERDGCSSSGLTRSVVKEYCARAYNKVTEIKIITVTAGQVTHDNEVLGYVAKNSPLDDGIYSILNVVPAAKSILLQVQPAASA